MVISEFRTKMSATTDVKLLQFKHPFRMMVAGPSGSGKTFLVQSILENHQIMISSNKTSLRVIWCYGQYQSSYSKPLSSVTVEYLDGLISESEMAEKDIDLIVVDDLMNELSDNKNLGNLFTKVSHHRNISVIFIVQNLFHQGKQMRNIHTNYDYLIVMKNTRDRSQIDRLGQQMKRRNALLRAYSEATKEPYGYLLIDFTQDAPEKIIFRSRILPINNIKGYFLPIIYSSE